ncbi:MAG: aldehyde dehydrogenase family protein [Novosphingobium sp.]|jgi:aldehyde dehydrogenase (NAD+)|nr:aldehyde dehydrogenase family protein [Novosphingobium sp.]
MNDYLPMTINGEDAHALHRLEILNPASGETFATVPDAAAEDLDMAVAAARAAFPAWSARPYAGRQAIVARIGDTIMAGIEELSHLLTREQGKPIGQAQFEIAAAAQWAQATAGFALPVTVVEDSPEHRVETRHVPLGVVGAISPWNFPVLLSIWKIAPALLAGNTLVLKPSPFTPLAVLRLGQLLREVVPAGVLNIVTGGDHLGPLMTRHAGFAKISFTGSTATGRQVMGSAAPTLKRLTLELGGNDPAIVFPDVDIEKTAEKLFWSAFTNSGQVCVATKRAYVHDAIYDRFLGALTKLAGQVPMGDGAEQGTALGPIQNRLQYDRVRALIDDSRENGHRVIAAGTAPAGTGYFVPVTLIDNPPEDSRIVREEQFGPVLPLLRFSDEEDAVARANASEYGLAATIWTSDEDRALRIADRLDAGSVWINEGLALSPLAVFGGHKQSGVGKENGVPGLLEFTNSRTVTIRRQVAAV